MTTTLQQKQTAKDFAAELRANVIEIEFSCKHIGSRRKLNQRFRDDIESSLEAKRDTVSAQKRLYAKGQPEIQKIRHLMRDARACFIRYTINGGQRGRRLLKRELLSSFESDLEAIRGQIAEACREADDNYTEIIKAASESLGEKLFDVMDYPATFSGSVSVSWIAHNHEPNEEWLQLAPAVYRREQERVAKRFEMAVEAFEQEARERLQELVGHLLAKLNPKDGKQVVYRESAARNLREFFDRFQSLNVSSDSELNQLVELAEDALGDTKMRDLKYSPAKRSAIKDAFESVQSELDKLIEAAPERSISFDDLED